jgi:hypothetical protein
MVAGQPAHVAMAPLFHPKGAVVELKREIVVGKGGKEGEGDRPQIFANQPCLPSTQSLLSSSTSSCSYHAHSTDQKYQKQCKFISSFSKVLFIYYFIEIFRFYNMQ